MKGKVCVVTGGGTGIGRAAALQMAREGAAAVLIAGRREAAIEAAAAECRSLGAQALAIPTDVTREGDVARLVRAAVDGFGRLDVAFNNAGITIEKPLHEYSVAEWDRVNNTNVRGVFLAMKYQIPHMLTASKRALVGLVQAAALDYALQGIRVNTLIPGTTDTPFLRKAAGMENVPDAIWRVGLNQWVKNNVPGQGRLATAEEIASLALTLASDEHPFMTGAQIVIDGGKTAKAG